MAVECAWSSTCLLPPLWLSALNSVQESLQLCDLGLMLLKLIADRLTNGKQLTLASFPGAVVLPKRCFRALDMSGKSELLPSAHWPACVPHLGGRCTQ